MNKYGLPLAANSKQTILPALTKDGIVRGWYPIAQTIFTGAETTFTLPDITVPLSTVTVDAGSPVKQYMAAVWPLGLASNLSPWASASLVSPADGYYRWWSMPTSTWMLREGNGLFLDAIQSSLNRAGAAALPSAGAPAVNTPQTLTWQASIAYAALTGGCSFFDFNWVTLFTPPAGVKATRIEIISTPPAGTDPTPPMLAKVIGIPTAVGGGTVMYDTLRIIKNRDNLAIGAYVFTMKIYSDQGVAADVTLTINVV